MEPIRTIIKVVNHQLSIELPEGFEEKKVEVIILPHTPAENKQSLSDVLLAGPVWSVDEVKQLEATIQRGYRNWTISGF